VVQVLVETVVVAQVVLVVYKTAQDQVAVQVCSFRYQEHLLGMEAGEVRAVVQQLVLAVLVVVVMGIFETTTLLD
jgi:hypothetical protein